MRTEFSCFLEAQRAAYSCAPVCAGLRCSSYTVNDEWAAQRLIDLGTDGIITDRVDLFSPAQTSATL